MPGPPYRSNQHPKRIRPTGRGEAALSTTLQNWASNTSTQNDKQRAALMWMADNAAADGTVSATKTKMAAALDITIRQAETAVRGLVSNGLITSQWNMDTYTHIYTLQAANR